MKGSQTPKKKEEKQPAGLKAKKQRSIGAKKS